MNFLFLNSARRWGGNENWIKLAAHSLNDQDHRSILAYRKNVIAEHFTIPTYKYPFHHEADLLTIAGLIRLVRSKNIDVVIPTKQKDYFLGGVVARYCRVLNILRLGIVRSLGESWIKKMIYHDLCDGIIVNAKRIKDRLLESSFLSAERIAVIHNGIDIDLAEKKAQAKQIQKKFKFVICTSGMLISRKRIDLLLQSFHMFMRHYPTADAGIYIIGAGEQEAPLKRLCADLDIKNQVIFWGFQQNPYPFLAQADVFTLSSENEGISNAMLEAMALKKPVIAADSGGTREVINDQNGFLVDWTETQTVAKLFEQLYANQNLGISLGTGGFTMIRKEFALDVMKQQMISFCRKMDSIR